MSPRRRPPQARTRTPWRTVLLFLSPLFVVYAIYFVYSIVFLVNTSMTRVSITFLNPLFVGFKNFEQLIGDPVFRGSILNNLVFAAISIGAALTIGFFIAVALATGVRAKRFFYAIFLLPALMPVSLVATIFGSMLEQRYGVLNETLRAIGLGELARPWLTEPGLAYGVVAVLFCYLIGLPIMYYTADLSGVNTSAIEAALLDGAGAFRIMRSVIFPMMSATHLTVILALLLGSFRALEVVLFSTGGGPADSTDIVGTYIYGFATSSGPTIGFVAAASIIVLLIALVIAIVQMILTRPRKVRR